MIYSFCILARPDFENKVDSYYHKLLIWMFKYKFKRTKGENSHKIVIEEEYSSSVVQFCILDAKQKREKENAYIQLDHLGFD